MNSNLYQSPAWLEPSFLFCSSTFNPFLLISQIQNISTNDMCSLPSYTSVSWQMAPQLSIAVLVCNLGGGGCHAEDLWRLQVVDIEYLPSSSISPGAPSPLPPCLTGGQILSPLLPFLPPTIHAIIPSGASVSCNGPVCDERVR